METESGRGRPPAAVPDTDALAPVHAALFASLCQFVWLQGAPLLLVYEIGHEVYGRHGLDLPALKRLEAIGLIVLEPAGFVKGPFGRHARLRYHDRLTKIEFQRAEGNRLDLGHVLLTQEGKVRALDAIGRVTPNQAFYDYVTERWFRQGMTLSSVLAHR